MTSAVIHRSDGLRLIDQHFERFYEDYTNESVGIGNDAEFGLGREQCDLNDTHLGKLHTFMQENLSQTKYKQEVYLLIFNAMVIAMLVHVRRPSPISGRKCGSIHAQAFLSDNREGEETKNGYS